MTADLVAAVVVGVVAILVVGYAAVGCVAAILYLTGWWEMWKARGEADRT